MCNDYKARGGFLFANGSIGWNCFNCGYTTRFDDTHGRPSKKFISLLNGFGIPEDSVKAILMRNLASVLKHEAIPNPQKAKEDTPFLQQPTIELPPHSLPVMGDHEWCEVARAYLESRAIAPETVRAFVSLDPKYEGRIILPVYDYTDERLVYWQARSMDDSEPRFKNPVAGKETAIFNEAALHQHGNPAPIYVTEGIFDAWSCGSTGIAPMGSKLTEHVLHKFRRASLRGKSLVFVIDKNDKNNNGYNLGVQALSEGWKIVVMPDNISDANKCRQELGSMFLASWLASQQQAGVAANLTLELKCKRR